MVVNQRLLFLTAKLLELGATPLEVAEVLDRTGPNPDEDRVYVALKQMDPELAETFRKQMNLFVWRTDLRKEPFKRSRIVKSLVKETGISKSLAEKIAREVEAKVRESDLTFITSSLIRELALIKLIEYGMEEAYRKYARLGIPLYDINAMRERSGLLRDKVAGRIFLQYSVLYLLPKQLVEAIFEGYVEVGGVYNPFVPYAQTYLNRYSSRDRWWQGLFNYLHQRPYVDVPSIFVPSTLEREDLEIITWLKKVYGAILWSTEPRDGIKVSDVPVYSFGAVPDRKVLDLITIDLEKIFLSGRNPWELLGEMSKALEEFEERKKEIVKGGNLYIRFLNPERAQKEKVEEIFESFRILWPSE